MNDVLRASNSKNIFYTGSLQLHNVNYIFVYDNGIDNAWFCKNVLSPHLQFVT